MRSTTTGAHNHVPWSVLVSPDRNAMHLRFNLSIIYLSRKKKKKSGYGMVSYHRREADSMSRERQLRTRNLSFLHERFFTAAGRCPFSRFRCCNLSLQSPSEGCNVRDAFSSRKHWTVDAYVCTRLRVDRCVSGLAAMCEVPRLQLPVMCQVKHRT